MRKPSKGTLSKVGLVIVLVAVAVALWVNQQDTTERSDKAQVASCDRMNAVRAMARAYRPGARAFGILDCPQTVQEGGRPVVMRPDREATYLRDIRGCLSSGPPTERCVALVLGARNRPLDHEPPR